MKTQKYSRLDANLNSIISICYYGRSGSVFLQSLLDDHPNLIAFPGTYLMGYQEWWDSLSEHGSTFCAEEFLRDYKVIFDPEHVSEQPLAGCGESAGLGLNFHKAGEYEDRHIKVDRPLFEKALFELVQESHQESASSFFKKLHFALAKALGKSVNERTKIVFSLHSPALRRSKFIIKDFEDRKFIHVIRDPVTAAYSLYKHYEWNGFNIGLAGVIAAMNAFAPISGEDENSRAVKLEDLHFAPRETLNKICNWINIEWSDTLLESTFLGVKWGNMAGTERVSGFNQVIPNKTHSDICSELDRARLAWVFGPLYKKWCYHRPDLHVRFYDFFRRFQIEKTCNLRTMTANRLCFLRTAVTNDKAIRALFRRSHKPIIRLL